MKQSAKKKKGVSHHSKQNNVKQKLSPNYSSETNRSEGMRSYGLAEQTELLHHPHLSTTQRQALAQQIGQTHGNQQLQRLVENRPGGRADQAAVSTVGEPLADFLQREEPESDQQGKNINGEYNYLRLSNEQQALIDSFCSAAHADIGKWSDMRTMHMGAEPSQDYDSYIKDLHGLNRKMNKRFTDFERDFLFNTPTVTTREADLDGLGSKHKHDVPFFRHQLAQKEVLRQLDSGFFRQYMEEMLTIHSYEVSLHEYASLFKKYGGLEIKRSPHHYDLLTIFGAEGGAGEVVTGGASLKFLTIKYENQLGMSWKINTYGASGQIGAGVSLSPIQANVESSLGSTEINAGSADEYKYFPPNYFNYNFVSLASGSAVLGGGYAVSTMSIGQVTFDTSGIVVKAGTADVGEAGLDIGLGFTVGGTPYDYEGLGDAEKQEMKPREGQWVAVIGAKVYFRSAENELDSDDIATIEGVVSGILNHETHYPGDTFKISVMGTATERWLTPGKSAREQGVDVSDIDADKVSDKDSKDWQKAGRLNQKLAEERGQLVFNELSSQIQSHTMSFTPGVLDKVQWKHSGQVLYTDPTDAAASDNDPNNRGAVITIYYNTTPEGNVKYNP